MKTKHFLTFSQRYMKMWFLNLETQTQSRCTSIPFHPLITFSPAIKLQKTNKLLKAFEIGKAREAE